MFLAIYGYFRLKTSYLREFQDFLTCHLLQLSEEVNDDTIRKKRQKFIIVVYRVKRKESHHETSGFTENSPPPNGYLSLKSSPHSRRVRSRSALPSAHTHGWSMAAQQRFPARRSPSRTAHSSSTVLHLRRSGASSAVSPCPRRTPAAARRGAWRRSRTARLPSRAATTAYPMAATSPLRAAQPIHRPWTSTARQR